MRITIKDIAREAGVSISTVSYVVNESGPVSKEKRELVEALVRKYNYKANPSARNLKSRRTRTIGIIGNLKKYGPDKTVIESIAKICKEKGYTMLLVADTENHEHSISFLRDHRVEGIVFIDNKTEMLGFPVPGDLPVIFAYCAHKERLSSSILPDDEQGGSLAAAHLL
ncbi:MAG: LacI family DNA-binding transcriptional regulator, partial [Spirochaetaceae bacterium]|nr:LacI family DNA-binding transcriptional regulator [Spirochaetaceae bacterium]